MSVQTDKTLKAWKRAAIALGPETSILIIAAVAKAAHRIGASEDTEADAMPHAFIGYQRDGVSIDQAAYQSVLSMHRREQTRQSDPSFVSLDDVETTSERDALEASIHAAGLGRDDVARSYGGGSYGSVMSLTEALEIAPQGASSIVSAIITDGLTRKIPCQNVGTTTADGATGDEAMALHGGMRDRRFHTGTYAPLKVSVVALAAGIARPRTKAASTELRKAGCKAYAMVQSVRDEDESVETLAVSAYRYVTRDRRAYGGKGQAVWQRDARPENVDYALYRQSSDFHPDIFNGSQVTPLQPVRGYRVNTGTKGRKGPKAGQPSEDTAHGASAARTCGALFSATGGPNDAGLTAKRSERSDSADLAAHEAQDARAQGTSCKRAILVWRYGPDGPDVSAATCGCGPTNGQALILQTRTRDIMGKDEVITYWTHALSVCPVPVAYRSDSDRQACGCGRKRGALTVNGEHRAR